MHMYIQRRVHLGCDRYNFVVPGLVVDVGVEIIDLDQIVVYELSHARERALGERFVGALARPANVPEDLHEMRWNVGGCVRRKGQMEEGRVFGAALYMCGPWS